MKLPAQTAPMNQEAALLDYAKRLQKFTAGRRAVHVRLSQLRPYNRREHHLRIAGTTFDRLVRDFEAVLFRLFNDDMVVVCNGASVADIDHSVLHLRYLFSEDPILNNDEEDGEPFCAWFDLEKGYAAFLELAQQMVSARAFHDTRAASAANAAPEPAPTRPLDPPNLVVIEAAIAHADLSNMICRQPICAVVQGHKPEPVYYEIYTSIESLRRTLLPDTDIHANPWLFQDLTRYLDRRVIAYLVHNDDDALQRSFSLNLNISTLLSPEFLDFDEALNSGTRSGIVIELQLVDVFADLGNFLFARDFLRERGYKFCLDGMTHLSLSLIDREKLEFDLVKLLWSTDLYDHLGGVRGEQLRQATGKVGQERLILAHCDSDQALEVGRSLGISLYQGQLLDDLLSKDVTREESVQALTKAMTRHRAATRG